MWTELGVAYMACCMAAVEVEAALKIEILRGKEEAVGSCARGQGAVRWAPRPDRRAPVMY